MFRFTTLAYDRHICFQNDDRPFGILRALFDYALMFCWIMCRDSHSSCSNCLRDRSLKQRSHEHKLISFQTTIAISFVCVLYYWPRFAWVDHAIFHISWKYYIYIGACHHHPAFERYRSENSQRQHWPQRYSPSAILACSSRVVCHSQLFILLCMHVSSVSCCLCVLWSERL